MRPRYERDRPGELLHSLGTQKPGRFQQPSHRVTGDRTEVSRHAGGQALRAAIAALAALYK